MSKTAITSPELAPPVGPFSQAIEVDGFLFFSGQVAQDPATGKVVEGGIVAETERVFQNLSVLLMQAPVKLFGEDMTKQGAVMVILEDQHEHLGQSIAYARSNGVVPPWSK